MTKSELIRALDKYPDNAEVVIGVEGFDSWRCIDSVEDAFGEPGLLSETTPNAYDLCTYAESFYKTGSGDCESREAFDNWRELL